MSGGLMQLVAYGAQDIYLSGNPQITFFKSVYRRYTNFAVETIEHPFIGNIDFNNRVVANIIKSGDLISKMYLRIVLNAVNPGTSNFAWVRRIGHAIINEIEVDVGGTKIDKQTGTWLDIWYELTRKGDHEKGYAKMIGDTPELTTYDNATKPSYVLYVPLQFWFNRLVGLSIPLIALQYHDVHINVRFEPINKLIIRDCNFDASGITLQDASILVNYVYLDSEERRRFAIVGHEYLIEQIQFNGEQFVLQSPKRYKLDYNHPTKELLWAMRYGNYISGKPFVYYTNTDEWNVDEAACNIIEKSISIKVDPTNIVGGKWVPIPPNSVATVRNTQTSYGYLNVHNKNINAVFVNPNSLRIVQTDNNIDYGITDKIIMDVTIDEIGNITCENTVTQLTVRDISFPVDEMIDTRFNKCDPIVYIFSNYGLLIDGTVNPVTYGLLQLNGHDRFDQREGAYFNYVQPEQHHENTPRDGINVYSFSLFPEQHQPSGASNLSRIDSTDLILQFGDTSAPSGVITPVLNVFLPDSRLFIFGYSYNILRILAGYGALAYTAVV